MRSSTASASWLSAMGEARRTPTPACAFGRSAAKVPQRRRGVALTSSPSAPPAMSSLAAARADNFYYPPEWTPDQGGLNKFRGTHALGKRASKLNQGILVIRCVRRHAREGVHYWDGSA
jgi:hypothetical protein